MDYAKEFYFIQDKTENILKTDLHRKFKRSNWLFKNFIDRLYKHVSMDEREGKEEITVQVNDSQIPFTEFINGNYKIDSCFEKNENQLELIKKGSLFQQDQRCIEII